MKKNRASNTKQVQLELPTPFPFDIDPRKTKMDDIAEVESELKRLIDIYKRDGELTLVCYCAPKRCHALTIKNEIERRLQEADFK